MYDADDLRKLFNSPQLALREVNRAYHSGLRRHSYNPDGIDVFAEDWDTLIILDACRYDYFAKQSTLPGELQFRISRGSTSPEWVRGNFDGRKLHDIVYISGNPWLRKLQEEDRIDTEIHDFIKVNSASNDPSSMTEKALEKMEAYPNKRHIIHYMYPHVPWIGPTAESHASDIDWSEYWSAVQNFEQTPDPTRIQQMYSECLDAVLGEVDVLLKKLEGRTVVSADHGELLGDRIPPTFIRDYAHHAQYYVPELVKVPWLIYETGDRREIRAEEPVGSSTQGVPQNDVDQRLRNLGYRV